MLIPSLIASCATVEDIKYSSFFLFPYILSSIRHWNPIRPLATSMAAFPPRCSRVCCLPILTRSHLVRGRVVKGVGHLDHVWSYGAREVVSSIPDRGNIVGWVFHPDRVTGKVFSSEHAFPSKFWIYLEHCPRGEAVITGQLRLSSMR